MRGCARRFSAAIAVGTLILGVAANASASPPQPETATLPTGSTTPLPGTRVPTAKLDDWVTLMARAGLASGAGTGFDGSVELLFVETMGIGFGFMGTDRSTTYLRLTWGMLDVKYWLWTGYADFLSDAPGVNMGTALSIPMGQSHNVFLRLSLATNTETGDKLFGAGMEVAVW